MESVEVTENWYTTKDDQQLFTRTWKAVGQVKANLVMVHGFGEHSGRYLDLFKQFAARGIECYCWDQRGFGETAKKSKGQGNNQGWDKVLGDVDDAVLRHKQDNISLILMGHSMGGEIVLSYLGNGDTYKGVAKVTAAISSAPLVRVVHAPPAPIYFALKNLAAPLIPWYPYTVGLDPKGVSRDPQEVKRYKEDPLINDTATLATLKSMLTNGELVLNTLAAKITTPILVVHGTADSFNSYDAAKQAYERISSTDKAFHSYEGCYHECELVPRGILLNINGAKIAN
ncbi:hypothetical protein NQZ79_g5226 [Umbelopsis isabellina]|nr:hypothetical protein NQZ79_g5226 [Umbelopsis isabellina]